MITSALEMRRLRHRLGLTQPKMAERMGLSFRGYQFIESERVAFRKIHGLAASFVELTADRDDAGNRFPGRAAA